MRNCYAAAYVWGVLPWMIRHCRRARVPPIHKTLDICTHHTFQLVDATYHVYVRMTISDSIHCLFNSIFCQFEIIDGITFKYDAAWSTVNLRLGHIISVRMCESLTVHFCKYGTGLNKWFWICVPKMFWICNVFSLFLPIFLVRILNSWHLFKQMEQLHKHIKININWRKVYFLFYFFILE